ncbi:MAG: ABC transporter substrate-binding protein [Pseudonocardia sp.]|nr:ABC transporter substrate-binding protein [Pseudonocardia sp.]MBO0873398.1 ABC transporter substrate-binding protein [Pseudonocardia sp.]
MVFQIQPHVRLHEWVAEELGLFRDEGLEYEFDAAGFAGGSEATVASAASAPLRVRSGAFEDMAAGRASDVSCACHWAVNAASANSHGKMYGKAYSVCPSSIFVAPDSRYREPADLAGVEVGVGYHSGSHYSALQALEPFLSREQIKLGFIGRPFDRARQLLAGTVPAVNVWGAPAYLLEQRGFRKLVDTTFVMGFLLSGRAETADVQRYFRALLRAQREIDLEPHRYTRHWARELPADLLELVDVRRFGPGERIVDAPYTKDMFERTQGWMRGWDLLQGADAALARYEESVLA